MIGTKVLRQHRVGDWLALLVVPPFSEPAAESFSCGHTDGTLLATYPRSTNGSGILFCKPCSWWKFGRPDRPAGFDVGPPNS